MVHLYVNCLWIATAILISSIDEDSFSLLLPG